MAAVNSGSTRLGVPIRGGGGDLLQRALPKAPRAPLGSRLLYSEALVTALFLNVEEEIEDLNGVVEVLCSCAREGRTVVIL